MRKPHYLTLAALAMIASACIYIASTLVFNIIFTELGFNLLFSLFLALGPALPLILIALGFFRKAQAARVTEQVAV